MSTQLWANIGIGHENDKDILEQRIVSAAQCNADAVVINKSTPEKCIPKEKKYVPIKSKWGTKAYIDVAIKSELDEHNIKFVHGLCKDIGIPLIWSVTDQQAINTLTDFVKIDTVKMHFDAVEPMDIIRHCKARNYFLWCSHKYTEEAVKYGKHFELGFYYTTARFPPKLEGMQLNMLDELTSKTVRRYKVGYESREEGIFPSVAVAYKPGIQYIEKYLGDDDSDNASVLTPAQFFDMWNSMNILAEANGTPLE